MSNGTIRNAADITAAIDEIIEYLKTGDENWQALMHANLLLTNLMRLLRPIAKPARQPDSRSRYGAVGSVATFDWRSMGSQELGGETGRCSGLRRPIRRAC
jgi:hypothetical protein